MNLYNEIKIARVDKSKRLDVHHVSGSVYSYTPHQDAGYLKYRNARNKVAQHKIIEKILIWCELI